MGSSLWRSAIISAGIAPLRPLANEPRGPACEAVLSRPGKTLLVEFDNGERRVYDCKPLLDSEVFRPLEDETLFRCVHADTHGYRIVWNDAIDLAESETWLNGQPAGPEEPSNT